MIWNGLYLDAGRVKDYRQWHIRAATRKVEIDVQVHTYYHGVGFNVCLNKEGFDARVNMLFGGVALWIGRLSTSTETAFERYEE